MVALRLLHSFFFFIRFQLKLCSVQLPQMKNGEIYRGLLLSAEDTMNMSLSEVLRTARNGQITKLPNVYLRGSSIRFIALPELLKNAPVFQKVTTMKRKMEQAQQERIQAQLLPRSSPRKRSPSVPQMILSPLPTVASAHL